MVLNDGEYLHIIHRQLFPNDARRHFVGTVEGHEGNLVRVKGYLFAMDSSHSQFVRREDLRTRVVSLNDGSAWHTTTLTPQRHSDARSF